MGSLRTFLSIFWTFVFIFLPIKIAQAGPVTLTHSGIAQKKNGNLLEGNKRVRFYVYDQDNFELWNSQDEYCAVADEVNFEPTTGAYSVTLGENPNNPLPIGLMAQANHLEIEIKWLADAEPPPPPGNCLERPANFYPELITFSPFSQVAGSLASGPYQMILPLDVTNANLDQALGVVGYVDDGLNKTVTLGFIDPAEGPQGPTGPTGADGPQGPAGADGAPGAQGPAGADGAQGPIGPQGPEGPQGPAGIADPAGDYTWTGVHNWSEVGIFQNGLRVVDELNVDGTVLPRSLGVSETSHFSGQATFDAPTIFNGVVNLYNDLILSNATTLTANGTIITNSLDVTGSSANFDSGLSSSGEVTIKGSGSLSVEGPAHFRTDLSVPTIDPNVPGSASVGSVGWSNEVGSEGLYAFNGTNWVRAEGPEGPQGPAGADGAQGPAGPEGPQGPAGADGVAGPQGPAGADGAQGPVGPKGPIGPEGPEGPTGPQGPAGSADPSGNYSWSGFHTWSQEGSFDNGLVSSGQVSIKGANGRLSVEAPSAFNGVVNLYNDLILSNATTLTANGTIIANSLDVTGSSANFDSGLSSSGEVTIKGSGSLSVEGPADFRTDLTVPTIDPNVPGSAGVGSVGWSNQVGSEGLYAFNGTNWVRAEGPEGPQGPAGADGAQGPAGPEGPQGPAGADGAEGPQGPAGADGAQGPAGPEGPQGPAGADGAPGPQGPAGTDGAQGPQGPAGADGAQGPVGPTGPQGPAGTAGDPAGDYTWTGIHSWSEVGNFQNGLSVVDELNVDGAVLPRSLAVTETSHFSGLATFDSPTTFNSDVTISGSLFSNSESNVNALLNVDGLDVHLYPANFSQGLSSRNQVWVRDGGGSLLVDGPASFNDLLIIPSIDPGVPPTDPANVGALGWSNVAGLEGLYAFNGTQWVQAEGPEGPQGPAGADGAAGPAGPQGPQGPAGADGAQGPQGLAGADGAQGPIGPAGADGAQGPAGPTGPQGETGPQGPEGPQGPTGPAGPDLTLLNNTWIGTQNFTKRVDFQTNVNSLGQFWASGGLLLPTSKFGIPTIHGSMVYTQDGLEVFDALSQSWVAPGGADPALNYNWSGTHVFHVPGNPAAKFFEVGIGNYPFVQAHQDALFRMGVTVDGLATFNNPVILNDSVDIIGPVSMGELIVGGVAEFNNDVTFTGENVKFQRTIQYEPHFFTVGADATNEPAKLSAAGVFSSYAAIKCEDLDGCYIQNLGNPWPAGSVTTIACLESNLSGANDCIFKADDSLSSNVDYRLKGNVDAILTRNSTITFIKSADDGPWLEVSRSINDEQNTPF